MILLETEIDMGLDSLKIYIPKELKQKFKAMTALAGRDMSDVSVELIQQWVNQQEEIERKQ